MSKEISLEDQFIGILNKSHLPYSSKIFSLGGKLYLPDFVFNRLIVEVDEAITPRRLETIKEFKKCFGGYRLILLTNDEKHILEGAEQFDEVFDLASIKLLLSEVKQHLRAEQN